MLPDGVEGALVLQTASCKHRIALDPPVSEAVAVARLEETECAFSSKVVAPVGAVALAATTAAATAATAATKPATKAVDALQVTMGAATTGALATVAGELSLHGLFVLAVAAAETDQSHPPASLPQASYLPTRQETCTC